MSRHIGTADDAAAMGEAFGQWIIEWKGMKGQGRVTGSQNRILQDVAGLGIGGQCPPY